MFRPLRSIFHENIIHFSLFLEKLVLTLGTTIDSFINDFYHGAIFPEQQ
jgi:hypothetical protein